MSEKIDEKKQDKIIKDLELLGLSDKEAQVYLSLITLGEVGSSKIIKATGLHGQFVYQALGSLEEKNLIQHISQKGRKKFSAKTPDILPILVESKRLIAERLGDELHKLMQGPQAQHIEVFHGAEAYKAAEFHALKEAKDKEEYMILGGTGDQFARIIGREFNTYEALRNKKEISIRYIGNKEQKHELNVFSQARQRFEYRVLPGTFAGLHKTVIRESDIVMTTFGDPIITIHLTNPLIAASFKGFFETLWNIGSQ